MDKLDRSLGEIMGSNRPIRKGRSNKRSVPYTSKNKSVGRRVYVGNLTWATDWQGLKDFMRSAGDVKHADILEYEDGRSKGCAIVEYATAAGAKKAIKTLHDAELDGRPIFVREDREARGVGNGGGGRNGGGGSRGGFLNRGKNDDESGFDQPMFSPNSNLAHKIRNQAGPGCTVFVGNLPWSAEWQELKDICAKFGSVSRADVEQNEDGRSKGYGIVVFENRNGARKCIQELDGATYGDRELTVKLDKIRSSGEKYYRKGSGRGGGGRGGVKVFIGNIPWSVEWQDLKDIAKQYGNVTHADVSEGDDGRSRGYGIVTFADSHSAQNCINNLNGMLLDGRDLTVHYDNM